MPASMTAGELVELVKRNARAPVTAITSRENGSRGVGIAVGGRSATSLSVLGSLPPRNVFDKDGVIVCRGWVDALARMYQEGHLRKTKELVRLMGRAALDYIDRTGSPLIPESFGLGYHVYLQDKPPLEWLPDRGTAIRSRA